MTGEPNPIAAITDKRMAPPGILPRNIHRLALGGVAVVMILVIVFSGRSTPKPKPSSPSSPELPVQQLNDDKLIDYKRRIAEAAERLKIEQNQFNQEKQALASNQAIVSPGSGGPGLNSYGSPSTDASQKSWIQEEKEKREARAPFASNVALSYREEPKSANVNAAASAAQPLPAVPAGDPRVYGWPFLPPNPSATPQATGEGQREIANRGELTAKSSAVPQANLNRSEGKDYRLFEGTIIETVLTNRLDGTFSGPVNCMVSYDVYSRNHLHVLIPSGSRVLGDVHPVQSFDQRRLAVSFHRLIMPDGYSVNLDQFHGLDQIGETGLQDQINHHYVQIFGASIAIGLIAGLAQENTQYDTSITASDAYRQGVANSLAQSSQHVLDRFLNVLPTITIREGQRIKIYLAEDLSLPAYENHEIPSNI